MPDRYIVVFELGTVPSTAAADLISDVQAQLAVSGNVHAASVQSLSVLHILGQHAASSGPNSYAGVQSAAAQGPLSADSRPLPRAAAAQQAAATASQEPLPTGSGLLSSGLQGVVMQISDPAALAAVKAASSVKAVVPDRIVAAQQQQQPSTACIDPQKLSQGLVPTAVAKLFMWHGCKNAAAGASHMPPCAGADCMCALNICPSDRS